MADGDSRNGDIELQEKDSGVQQKDSARVQRQKDIRKHQNADVGQLQENKNSDQTKASGVSKNPKPDPPEKDYDTDKNSDQILSKKLTKEDKEQAKEASGVSKKPATSDNPPDPPTRDYYATEKSEVAGSSGVYASVKNKRKTLGSFVARPEFVYKPDSTEAWMSCLRIGLILFNLLIWVGAITVLFFLI